MTNYNERLCEILNTLGERHIMVEHRLIHIGMPEQNGKNIETRKAKQALTSLIKELVAEAKPGIHPYLDSKMDGGYAQAIYGAGVLNYQNNLLKALEEV